MNTVQKPVAHDRTVGTILGPGGDPILRPTLILAPSEMALIRTHLQFLHDLQLSLEKDTTGQLRIACRSCFHATRDSLATVYVTADQILISCGCRMIFGQGVTPPEQLVRYEVPPPPIILTAGVVEVPLPWKAAYHLRRYKTLLLKYQLAELLRCETCFHLGQSDGCYGRVTANRIEIGCRCRTLVFEGSTTSG